MVNLPYQRIREEDYWIFPIVLFNIVCIAVAIYASVLLYRAPGVVLGFLGIWFTSSKIRKGYSVKRAQLHIGFTLLFGILLAWCVYSLTK